MGQRPRGRGGETPVNQGGSGELRGPPVLGRGRGGWGSSREPLEVSAASHPEHTPMTARCWLRAGCAVAEK